MTAPVTREAAMVALFNLLSSSGTFLTKSRRFAMPDQIDPSAKPALIMCEPSEQHGKKDLITPAVRIMTIECWLYTAVGLDQNAIPATTVNNMIDAIDPTSGGVLAPNFQGRQTLGGLVTNVYIDGIIKKVPGDLDGLGVAMIPIKVVFMQP